MKTRLIYLILCVLFLSSCASSYYLAPTDKTPNMDSYYQNGREDVVSFGKQSTVAIYALKTLSNELMLSLYCRNDIQNRINFLPDQIEIIGYNKKGDSKSFYVYPAERYLAKMRREQNMAMIAMALGGAMQAAQAGYSTSTTTSSAYGTAYGPNGYATASAYGTSTTQTYDQSKVNEANYRNQQQLNQSAQSFNQVYNAVENGLVKRVTLFDNQDIAGKVMSKFSKSYQYKIVVKVPVGNDLHTFTFRGKR